MKTETLTALALLLAVTACGDKGDDTGDTGAESDTDTDTDTDSDTDTDADADADTDTDTDTDADLEIAGAYVDAFDSDHVVSNTEWSSSGGATVVALSQYDNTADWAVGQNATTNEYNPDLWSRFDWTTDADGGLWYCQTAFDAATEADVLAATAPDATDPATGGCGTFPWSALTPLDQVIELRGDWTDGWGGGHSISISSWVSGSSTFQLTQVDNDGDFAIAQNATTNEYNPDLWSRFDWTTDADGGVWYCQTAYAAATEADALATTRADDSDPANSGCGTFSWTSLTPATR